MERPVVMGESQQEAADPQNNALRKVTDRRALLWKNSFCWWHTVCKWISVRIFQAGCLCCRAAVKRQSADNFQSRQPAIREETILFTVPARHTRLKKTNRRALTTFEWLVIMSVTVIGVIGALGLLRNVLNDSLFDFAKAIDALYNPP